MKVGDRIKIVFVEPEYINCFRVGDIATLLYQDPDGYWMADFNGNAQVDHDGLWWVGPKNFVLLDPIETRSDIGEEDILP